MSPGPGSVTRLIQELQAETPDAARALWERFFARMLALARRRLPAGARREADEEDVAVVAFTRFLRGVRQGRFPRLNNRDDLWAILFTLTTRQAGMQSRQQLREKRGGGVGRGGGGRRNAPPPDGRPAPDEEVALQECLTGLLAALRDDELRQIALARLEGRSNKEIAASIGRAEVTVERRLKVIRETWRQAGLVEESEMA